MNFNKKPILIIIIFISLCINMLPQNAYYDSLKLFKNGEIKNGKILFPLNENDIKGIEIYKTLARYCKEKDGNIKLSEIREEYKDNPFILIKDESLQFDVLKNIISSFSVPPAILNKSVESSDTDTLTKFGISTTTIVSGIAKFIVKRFKEEMNVTFFRKFKEIIVKKEYEFLAIMFPETFSMLETIDNDIYNFSIYIQVLKEVFIKDLNNVYSVFPKIIKSNSIKNLVENLGKNKNILLNKNILFLVGEIFSGIKNKKHPIDILLNKKNSCFLKIISNKTAETHKIICILANSIKDQNSERYLIKLQSLIELFKNDKKLKLYLGLIWQELKAHNVQNTFFGENIKNLQFVESNIEKVLKTVEFFNKKISLLEIEINRIKDKRESDKKPDYNDYYSFFANTLKTAKYFTKFIQDILDKKELSDDLESIVLRKEIEEYFEYGNIINSIFLDANKKNYSALVFNIIGLFDKIFIKKINDNYVIETKNIKKYKKKYHDIRKKLLKYGAFMAAVASAENSDQVSAAIEAVVLPVGSSSIKRNSSLNISLNAYLGGALIFKRKDDILDVNRARVWAPIGIALSLGKIECRLIQSISLYCSVIDIGAVTAFEFKRDSEEEMPEFSLKNIFSPGIHVIFGIKNLPFSFGGGYQSLPQLLTAGINGSNEITNRIWKWTIFIGVDIPLLNFLTN